MTATAHNTGPNVARLWNLQDLIGRLGFTPEAHEDGPWHEDWYIRDAETGGGTVRLVVDDAQGVALYRIDHRGGLLWDARFSSATPLRVLRDSIKSALR